MLVTLSPHVFLCGNRIFSNRSESSDDICIVTIKTLLLFFNITWKSTLGSTYNEFNNDEPLDFFASESLAIMLESSVTTPT